MIKKQVNFIHISTDTVIQGISAQTLINCPFDV